MDFIILHCQRVWILSTPVRAAFPTVFCEIMCAMALTTARMALMRKTAQKQPVQISR